MDELEKLVFFARQQLTLNPFFNPSIQEDRTTIHQLHQLVEMIKSIDIDKFCDCLLLREFTAWVELFKNLQTTSLNSQEKYDLKKVLLFKDEVNANTLLTWIFHYAREYYSQNPRWLEYALYFIELCINADLFTRWELQEIIKFQKDHLSAPLLKMIISNPSPQCVKLGLNFLEKMLPHEALLELLKEDETWKGLLIGELSEKTSDGWYPWLNTIVKIAGSPDSLEVFLTWLMKNIPRKKLTKLLITKHERNQNRLQQNIVDSLKNPQHLQLWFQWLENILDSKTLKTNLDCGNLFAYLSTMSQECIPLFFQWLEKYFSKEEVAQQFSKKVNDQQYSNLSLLVSNLNMKNVAAWRKCLAAYLPAKKIKDLLLEKDENGILLLQLMIYNKAIYIWHQPSYNFNKREKLQCIFTFLANYFDQETRIKFILAKKSNGTFILKDLCSYTMKCLFLIDFLENCLLTSFVPTHTVRKLFLEKETNQQQSLFLDFITTICNNCSHFYSFRQLLKFLLSYNILDQEDLFIALKEDSEIMKEFEKDLEDGLLNCRIIISFVFPFLTLVNQQSLLQQWQSVLFKHFDLSITIELWSCLLLTPPDEPLEMKALGQWLLNLANNNLPNFDDYKKQSNLVTSDIGHAWWALKLLEASHQIKKSNKSFGGNLPFFSLSAQAEKLYQQAVFLLDQIKEPWWIDHYTASRLGRLLLTNYGKKLFEKENFKEEEKSLRIHRLVLWLLDGDDNDICAAYSFLSSLYRPNHYNRIVLLPAESEINEIEKQTIYLSYQSQNDQSSIKTQWRESKKEQVKILAVQIEQFNPFIIHFPKSGEKIEILKDENPELMQKVTSFCGFDHAHKSVSGFILKPSAIVYQLFYKDDDILELSDFFDAWEKELEARSFSSQVDISPNFKL